MIISHHFSILPAIATQLHDIYTCTPTITKVVIIAFTNSIFWDQFIWFGNNMDILIARPSAIPAVVVWH
jgi:hypothetical protein